MNHHGLRMGKPHMGDHTTINFLNYDFLHVSCDKCGNWVELDGNDPRRRAEGYGFRFNGDTPRDDFTCLKCDCPAQDRYYIIDRHDDDGEHDLCDVTDEIVSAFDRR